MKDKVYEEIAIDDVIIQDPNIANQIVQVQKQINDRLKRVAQINSEMATFKQQIGALKDRAIQAQKASMTTNQKAEAKPSPEGDAAPPVATESFVPSLAEFLNEAEPQYTPHFEDPAGTVHMGGKPRFQKYKKKVEREYTDKDWEKIDNTDREISSLRDLIQDLADDLEQLKTGNEERDMYFDNFAGSVSPEIMEILSSGIQPIEKIREFGKLGYTAKDYHSFQAEMDNLMKAQEEAPEKISKKGSEIKAAEEKLKNLEHSIDQIGVSYKDAYMPVEIKESVFEEETEREEDEDEEDIFYVQIPPQSEIDGEVIGKVFREEPGKRWYVRDVENEAEFLDELVFQKNYTKPEIIGYLASIFGDVLEIDQAEFEDLIDDKEELDDKYFPDREDKNNVRVKLVK